MHYNGSCREAYHLQSRSSYVLKRECWEDSKRRANSKNTSQSTTHKFLLIDMDRKKNKSIKITIQKTKSKTWRWRMLKSNLRFLITNSEMNLQSCSIYDAANSCSSRTLWNYLWLKPEPKSKLWLYVKAWEPNAWSMFDT